MECPGIDQNPIETDFPATTDELQNTDAQQDTIRQLQLTNLGAFPLVAFLSIGFTHHYTILTKVKDIEERKFYIQLCADLSLSDDTLKRKISEDAFHNQGKMPNNFGMTIPDYKRAFQAIQMFKNEYLLEYINVEQLGERDENIDERVIENEIVHNVKNFIMTFGRGFTYLGNQHCLISVLDFSFLLPYMPVLRAFRHKFGLTSISTLGRHLISLFFAVLTKWLTWKLD